MPRSMTVSEINRLGERLRKRVPIDPNDLAKLQTFRAEHLGPARAAQSLLTERLGLSSTSRIKTDKTIIDKLVRDRTRLSTMQDVAGLRVTRDMVLSEQREIAHSVSLLSERTEIVDRVADPRADYRAVHVVVDMDGFPVEIQIRTTLQHLWAEALEKMSDQWGRGIRYGDIPEFRDEQGRPLEQELSPVTTLHEISPIIADYEERRDEITRSRKKLPRLSPDAHAQLRAESPDVAKALDEFWSEQDGIDAAQTRLHRRITSLLTRIVKHFGPT